MACHGGFFMAGGFLPPITGMRNLKILVRQRGQMALTQWGILMQLTVCVCKVAIRPLSGAQPLRYVLKLFYNNGLVRLTGFSGCKVVGRRKAV